MLIAWTIYLVFGPLAWLGLAIASRAGVRQMGRLHSTPTPLDDPPPTLSIVVPARDEAAGIRDCVMRILAQDYPNAELVVVNDRSRDSTGITLDEIAAAEPRLRVLHVTELPEGWLGKCHALFVGTQKLQSEWLLFVDSDVGLTPDAARRAVALADRRRYEVVSLMPRLDARSFWERSLLPILAMAWAAAFKISFTNDNNRPDYAFANGQFFLVKREWYEKVGGHAAVRDRIVEDVALMRILKHAGARVRFLVGQQVAQTRMHTNLKQMFNGWARIFAGSSGRSPLPMISTFALLAWTLLSIPAAVVIAAVRHDPWWIAAVAAHILLVIGFMAWTYKSAGQAMRYALLVPLTWPVVMTILCYAIRVCRSGKVDWRGSAVTVNRG